MAAGDVKLAYRAVNSLDVTNLHSQPTNATWTTGWTSGTIDNSANLDLDQLIAGQFTVAAAGLAAGEIRMYVIPELYAGVWPDIYSTGVEGTQSASAVLHDTEIRDGLYLLWSQVTDVSASRVYTMQQRSLFAALGFVPRRYILNVAHSTGANLAAAGNAIHITGQFNNIAAA